MLDGKLVCFKRDGYTEEQKVMRNIYQKKKVDKEKNKSIQPANTCRPTQK